MAVQEGLTGIQLAWFPFNWGIQEGTEYITVVAAMAVWMSVWMAVWMSVVAPQTATY